MPPFRFAAVGIDCYSLRRECLLPIYTWFRLTSHSMDENPYESPHTASDAANVPRSEICITWRILAGFYGLMFSAFTGIGSYIDWTSDEPIGKFWFWAIISLLTCYGIFAFALPVIRFSWLAKPWLAFSIALPFAAYTMTYYENPDDFSSFSEVLLLQIAVFVAITLPAMACNLLLALHLLKTRNAA